MSVTNCPVFRPSMEELKNFSKYVENVTSQVRGLAGIVKIIPPKGFYVGRD